MDIACDVIGNPIHDGVWTYTWENGRQLRRMACDATIAEFVYNADGLRVQKTVNGVTTNYTLHGKNIVHMTKGNAELHFWYDAQNRPAIVEFNGTKYGYLYNLQGDVIGLIDSANTEVVKYTYDAWGKPLSVTGSLANTIGYYNPFRYRGYVYDVETGFYYVSSRYYDSKIGRWINADEQISGNSKDIKGQNLFSYCFNNSVNMIDYTGNWPSWSQIFAAVATVAIAAVFVATVVASAGAAGVAAGIAAASMGATGTMVSVAMTAGTIGTYTVAAGIGACALSNTGEILTGTNVIRDELMGGNEEAYDVFQSALNVAGGGIMVIGQTNPGVTGNAAKPSPDAQAVHTVPTIGNPGTSFDKLYGGNLGNFQRTYYDYRGKISLQIDFTHHGNPSAHSNPHLHIWGASVRGKQINLRYLN